MLWAQDCISIAAPGQFQTQHGTAWKSAKRCGGHQSIRRRGGHQQLQLVCFFNLKWFTSKQKSFNLKSINHFLVQPLLDTQQITSSFDGDHGPIELSGPEEVKQILRIMAGEEDETFRYCSSGDVIPTACFNHVEYVHFIKDDGFLMLEKLVKCWIGIFFKSLSHTPGFPQGKSWGARTRFVQDCLRPRCVPEEEMTRQTLPVVPGPKFIPIGWSSCYAHVQEGPKTFCPNCALSRAAPSWFLHKPQHTTNWTARKGSDFFNMAMTEKNLCTTRFCMALCHPPREVVVLNQQSYPGLWWILVYQTWTMAILGHHDQTLYSRIWAAGMGYCN